MQLIKLATSLIILLFILSSCQSVKNTLTMKKKKSVDEFLIEKKNPLTLPPDFTDLPEPNTKQIIKKENEDLDLSEVLGKSEKKKALKSSGELEKSISEILKKK